MLKPIFHKRPFFCHITQQNIIKKNCDLFSMTSQNKIALISLCLMKFKDLKVH